MTKLWTKSARGVPFPPLGKVTHLIIHCTATPEGLDLTADQISAMDMQRKDLGYRTAYHYVGLLGGAVENTIPEDLLGAHVGGQNHGKVGYSLVGGIDRVTKKPKDTRTTAQKRALRNFIIEFRKRHPGVIIKGHRDMSPDLNRNGIIEPNEWTKMCPCFDVQAWIAAGMPE